MINLVGNEIVLVQGITPTGQPSGQQEQTTTQAIANLGSGGITSLNGATGAVIVTGANITTAGGIITLGGPVVSSISGINGTATGSTTLYANATGKTLIVDDVVLLVTAQTVATNGPTVQIGSSATGSDVYSSEAITALIVVNKLYHFGGPGMSVAIPNGGSLFMDITSGATATSLTLEAIVIGYFV